MRKTLMASVLLLALCGPASAGDIPNPSTHRPPGAAAEESVLGGWMPYGLAAVLELIGSALARL